MDTTEYMLKALTSFATHLGQQEFIETQPRLVLWFHQNLDWKISARTLRTHTHRLRDQRKLGIRYTGDGVCYSLPDGLVTRRHVTEVATSAPGIFEIKHASTEVLSGESDPGYRPGLDSERAHRGALAMIGDLPY